MIKRDLHFPAPNEDWASRVVILWEEDDATRWDPSAEKTDAAFFRISNRRREQLRQLASLDLGDATLRLYDGGWVHGCTCEGGLVGVLVKPR